MKKKVEHKKDDKVNKFLDWYKLQYKKEDVKSSSKLVKRIIQLNQKKKISTIKIMIKAKKRFLNDIFQEIKDWFKKWKINFKRRIKIRNQKTNS